MQTSTTVLEVETESEWSMNWKSTGRLGEDDTTAENTTCAVNEGKTSVVDGSRRLSDAWMQEI